MKSSKKEYILIIILVIFHTVGICTMFSDTWRQEVLSLSVFNLLLTFAVLIASFTFKFKEQLLLLLIVFIFGVSVELIGIHTAYLFGNYQYGANLGLKFFGVPLIIGVNWGILLFTSGTLAATLFRNNIIRIIATSTFMLFLDFLIEPVAMQSDYWTWENDTIPIYNYLCWFFLSLPLSFLFVKLNIPKQNRLAICLYFIYVCFFGILNFY